MGIFWEWYQQGRIAEADQKATRAKSVAEQSSREMQHRVDALVLANAAMWSIMSEKLGVTEAQLIQRMRDLDAADGRIDGRAGPSKSSCKACRREVVPRNGLCIYCGAKVAEVGAFEKI